MYQDFQKHLHTYISFNNITFSVQHDVQILFWSAFSKFKHTLKFLGKYFEEIRFFIIINYYG